MPDFELSPQMQEALTVSKHTANSKPFRWTEKAHQVACLLAEGKSTANIVSEIGVGRQTLANWIKRPEFSEQVNSIRQAIAARLFRQSLSNPEYRLKTLKKLQRKLLRVIDERAADPEMQSYPGGSTGMLVRRERVVGKGEDSRTVVELEVDAALSREIRGILEQAAIEVGQWKAYQNDPAAANGNPKAVILALIAQMPTNQLKEIAGEVEYIDERRQGSQGKDAPGDSAPPAGDRASD